MISINKYIILKFKIFLKKIKFYFHFFKKKTFYFYVSFLEKIGFQKSFFQKTPFYGTKFYIFIKRAFFKKGEKRSNLHHCPDITNPSWHYNEKSKLN